MNASAKQAIGKNLKMIQAVRDADFLSDEELMVLAAYALVDGLDSAPDGTDHSIRVHDSYPEEWDYEMSAWKALRNQMSHFATAVWRKVQERIGEGTIPELDNLFLPF